MHKEITLQKQQVVYTLRKSNRARKMRLAVHLGGGVVVTAPDSLDERVIEKFIKEKASWLLKKIAYLKQFNGVKTLKSSRSHYLKYKEEARELLLERVDYFSDRYGFKYSRVSIKNQKTRWGSCSKKGNLNFNYKIFFLLPEIRDYIIVHELCHLKEFNHSRKFWALVEDIIPDYSKVRGELKRQGMFFQ